MSDEKIVYVCDLFSDAVCILGTAKGGGGLDMTLGMIA